MFKVFISLGGTPGGGVSIDLRTSGVEDSHEVEGEGASRSRSRAIIGDAAGTRTSASHGSRPRPSNLSKSSNLASEATSVLLLVGPELDLQGPRLAGGREDLSDTVFICSIKLFGHLLDPQEIALGNVKGLAPDVNLLS